MIDATATQQKPSRYMPAARRRSLLVELAVGETSMRILADKYGVTYQYVRRIASSERAEIEEIRAETVEKERSEIWATDRFSRNLERLTDLVRIEEEMAKLAGDEPAPEQWLKLIHNRPGRGRERRGRSSLPSNQTNTS
jgi:lambda repressor-like predicted transcriptional regulator